MERQDIRIEAARDFIEAELHRSLRMADLARHVELSVAQLTRLFRDVTGLTPGAYLHERRMLRARTLVERTTLPVAEIMRQVGISDRSHFARDFRRAHGLSPRTLRVQLRMTGGSARATVLTR